MQDPSFPDDPTKTIPEPIYFEYGDYVYYSGDLYECIQLGSHTGMNPSTSPNTWQLCTPMTDDLRLDPTSPHQEMGLLDN